MLIRPRTAAHAKRRIKSSTIAVYTSVFVLLIVLIAVGYRSPQAVSSLANAAPITSSTSSADTQTKTVDAVVASSIAANVASATNLSVAPSVMSLAISTQIESALPSTANSAISKPQIIEISSAGRKITSYTVASGDTVDSVAGKFGISAETIKWANNLTTNTLQAGTNLDILPRNGIAYIVESGDTLKSIAEKYKADASSITAYNDLEISGVSTGMKIIVPNADLPTQERPGYIAPVAAAAYAVTYGYSAGFNGNTWRIRVGTPMYAGNTYYTGNCTAYAYDRRTELGLAVSAQWGNANTWDNGARASGLAVTNSPSVGSIMQNEGGYGHVAIVEKLLPNGDIEVSEMNASVSGGGWNIVSGRTISASAVNQYAYIR
jgi:surface antigen/LysM repeat protein